MTSIYCWYYSISHKKPSPCDSESHCDMICGCPRARMGDFFREDVGSTKGKEKNAGISIIFKYETCEMGYYKISE